MGQPEIRDKIIRGWGLQRACEVMGLGDVMALLWAECEAGGGMHFCGQRSVAVELIDPASGAVLPWVDGVRGEAVYTTFSREATPVLRHRSYVSRPGGAGTTVRSANKNGVSRCPSAMLVSPSASDDPRRSPAGRDRWQRSPASTWPSGSPPTRWPDPACPPPR